MRVFIAVEFNDSIKKYLYDKQQDIIKLCTRGNFTRKNNFHLTLKFIGEAGQDDISKLKQCIDAVSEVHRPFTLTLGGIGQFPKGNRKIIWVGVKESQQLQMLYRSLESCLESQGFSKDPRGYNPHITLGREVVSDFKKVEENIGVEEAVVSVNAISLMESRNIEGVLTYTPIYIKNMK